MIKKIKKATAILGLTILLSINSTSASADTTYEYSVLDEEDAPDQDEEQQEEETEEEETEDEETEDEEYEEYENTVTYYTDEQTAQFYEEVKPDLSDIKVLLFGIMITISFAGGYILSLIFKK